MTIYGAISDDKVFKLTIVCFQWNLIYNLYNIIQCNIIHKRVLYPSVRYLFKNVIYFWKPMWYAIVWYFIRNQVISHHALCGENVFIFSLFIESVTQWHVRQLIQGINWTYKRYIYTYSMLSVCRHFSKTGDVSIYGCHLTGIGIPIIKIRRSHDNLIFTEKLYREIQSLYWNRIQFAKWESPSPLQWRHNGRDIVSQITSPTIVYSIVQTQIKYSPGAKGLNLAEPGFGG